MDFIFAILGSLLLSFIIALILTIHGDNKNTNFLQKFIGIASFLIIIAILGTTVDKCGCAPDEDSEPDYPMKYSPD